MNEVEIDLLKRLLEMDPYRRLTATEALKHEYFDELRSNDSEYKDEETSLELNGTLVQESNSQIGQTGKRMISPPDKQKGVV